MYTERYPVKGMHCASCSSIIEKTIKKVAGVHAVEVNVGTEHAQITFDPEQTNVHELSKKIEPLGYWLVIETNQDMQEKNLERVDLKVTVISVIPLALMSIIVMTWEMLGQVGVVSAPTLIVKEFFHHLLPIFATYTLFVVGKPYLLGLYRFIRYGTANMDTLIGLGTVAAFLYSFVISAFEGPLGQYINVEHTYYDVTIVVISFIALGKYLEARAKIKTGDALKKLLNLQVKTALIIRGNTEKEIPITEVVPGDHIIVKPGARIPVDGVVREGTSFVDEAMITGESMPVEKTVKSKVVAGTVNTTGTFVFEATHVGAETLLFQIITMVQEAQESRAPIQALADKISAVFVPIVLVIAVVTLLAWLGIGTHVLGFSQALSYGLVSFVGVLVIACPCALGLATPTAIIVGVGKGAQEGILIKDAATLEKLHHVDTVVFDKTGTITKGKPVLVAIHNGSMLSDTEVISILASLERTSEHPLALAVIEYAKEHRIKYQEVTHFEAIKGKGVTGIIEGVRYFAGNVTLMQDRTVRVDDVLITAETMKGNTPILLATSENVLALVMVADVIKPEAEEMIIQLHKLGITTIMLTGDNKNTARLIAQQVGIDEVIGEMLPQDKLKKIKELQKQGRVVAMVGDGINDAPALAIADVGIAMGTGTDVAIETAGITLLMQDIGNIVKAINLSKLTMRGIKQNLFWAFFYNIIGIPLAAGVFYPFFGWLLNPVFAGFAMACSSVSVVGNSLRLKTKKL